MKNHRGDLTSAALFSNFILPKGSHYLSIADHLSLNVVETLIANYSFGGILIFVIKRAPISHQCLKFQVFEHLSLAGGNLSVGSNINFQFSN